MDNREDFSIPEIRIGMSSENLDNLENLENSVSNVIMGSITKKIDTQVVDHKLQHQNSQEDLQPQPGSVLSQYTGRSSQLFFNAKRIREKVIIYEYMCYRTSVFYTRLNKVLLYPSICISGIIALLNSNLGTSIDQNQIQLVNVIGNSILTFTLTLKGTLKHAEKADYFFNMKKKFTSLHNKLNAELLDGEITESQLQIYLSEYDTLDENLVYQFPDSVIKDVKTKFEGHSMPTICNGIETVHEKKKNGKVLAHRKKTYNIPDIV